VIRFLVDQNFNSHVLEGLVRRESALDYVHVRDVGLSEAIDSEVLSWASEQNRVLLTHDRRTIPRFAYERVTAGLPMPGVFLVDSDMSIGQAIDEIFLAMHCFSAEEIKDTVR
jgi:Domain of unknown function (DUF5615)